MVQCFPERGRNIKRTLYWMPYCTTAQPRALTFEVHARPRPRRAGVAGHNGSLAQKPRPGRENRAGVFKGIWHGMAYRTTCTEYHGPAAVSTLFFRSVIKLTIQQWRSLRWNRRCRYCAHSRVFHGRDGDLYFCAAKGKLVYEGLPRWLCQVYTVEEDF